MSKRNSTTRTAGAIRRNPGSRPGLLLAVLGTALALTATGCGSEADSAEAQESPGTAVRIGLSLPNVKSDFNSDLLSGARAEAEKQGARLTIRDAGDDEDRQGEDLEHFADQSMGAVVYSPVNPANATTNLRRLTDEDIPTVTAGRTGDTPQATSIVAPDHAPSGRIAAEALATALDGKGDIVVLRGSKDNAASKHHYDDFRAGLKPHEIRIAATRSAGFKRAQAEAVMSEQLLIDPTVTGVFAENDAMALGAADAVAAMGLEGISIVGFEGTEAGRKAVKNGDIAATVTDQPEEIGRVAVRNAVRAAKDEPVDKRILVPMRVVTKATIEEFE
ncbi:sugar ABC transporter substrate-binding protein [Streptomyces sp. XM4193]|uniref:sugar ABC transporter substrate-binding protein n=1 Tax=Streptomyces sp. XM4193 TaxID=2929782 RepID=UPI001FF90EB1|nr:sugar ABC transporter substrate-binding protein [Streptomyces sp. XM4193]MCK1798602.1 sugar ABC transporter substrate-binding protein [Streptomyces sp. XM4193]